MSIYTKTGDRGQTGLPGGRRVDKDDPCVVVCGGLDELSATLGVALAQGLDPSMARCVVRVQEELFTLCANLASAESAGVELPRVDPGWVEALEREIDLADTELPRLTHFIVPGGAPGAAWLHLARTVCRRAERSVVTLARAEEVAPVTLAYVNRLSDWLFTMARLANHRAGTPEPGCRR